MCFGSPPLTSSEKPSGFERTDKFFAGERGEEKKEKLRKKTELPDRNGWYRALLRLRRELNIEVYKHLGGVIRSLLKDPSQP